MKNFIEKKDLPLIAIIILSMTVVYLYTSLSSEREQYKKFREQSPIEFLAVQYCSTLKYTEENWKKDFRECIKDAEQNPLSTMNKYLSSQ